MDVRDMRIKVNWEHRRSKHAIERMWLRGISQQDLVEAIRRGQKRKQEKSGLLESIYSYYSVVYEEFIYKDIQLRKIYPVTVKLW